MLKFNILCTRYKSNYCSYIGRRSENICIRKKERGNETQFITKIGGKTSLGLQNFIPD